MKKFYFILSILFFQFINAQVQIGGDIDGEASIELLGSSAISDNGSIIAVGSSRNDVNGVDAGQVKVYSNVNDQWIQLGSTISGNTGDYFGSVVSLSSDGTILAVTANFINDYVKIFKYNGSDWEQLGGDIVKLSNEGYYSPNAIALSSNGNRIVIGDATNSDNGSGTGQVVIYEYNGTNWQQLGPVINGLATSITIDERFGSSVTISADGNRIGVGAPGSGLAEGNVRVYEYNGTDWIQLGFDFGPANQGGSTGASVSMSANGNRIAINVPGAAAPSAIIYDYNGSQWETENYFSFPASRVSLSADGNRLAVGNPLYDWTGDGFFNGEYGRVRIYNYDDFDGDWSQLGSDIIGETAWEKYGAGVSLSSDGNTFIAAAPFNDDNGFDGQGKIRIYDITFNTIFSLVSFDSNNNSCTSGSVLANNVKIEILNVDGNQVGFTNIDGLSKVLVQNGTYTVQPVINDARFAVSPISEEIEFNNIAETITVNFCVSSIVTVNDVATSVMPLEDARPGFESAYRITYENLGTTIIDGDVSIQFNDALQEYIQGTQTPPDTETSNTLTYNYSALQPFETRYIDVILKTKQPPIVNSDDILTLTSVINSNVLDDDLGNNVFTFNQIAVNSFDPNDKYVLEGDEITIQEIDNYLHYRIRFQNTGTASAVNVRIQDVISDNLDWDTFRPISASHTNYVQIHHGNSVDFNFENIQLPASQDDELNSHGFVTFKIKPKADIQIGDIISGNANIYFDYNLPIITNTVNTEIATTLSIADSNFEGSIYIYPNPTSDKIHVSSKEGLKIEEIALYSITGKLLLKDENPNNEINISDFHKGVYLLHILSDKGSVTKKIIIQ
ncbi:DUF7619 domain-containing protein [Lacinutrix sp. MEBiC02404]